MKVENILAKNITAAGDRANYDAACKRLLANKIILAWIMKSCLEEFRDFAVDEIAEKYIEGSLRIAQMAVNLDEVNDSKGEQIEGSKTEDRRQHDERGNGYLRYPFLCPYSTVERNHKIDSQCGSTERFLSWIPNYQAGTLLLQPDDFIPVWGGIYGWAL